MTDFQQMAKDLWFLPSYPFMQKDRMELKPFSPELRADKLPFCYFIAILLLYCSDNNNWLWPLADLSLSTKQPFQKQQDLKFINEKL